jgi:hypothetical protein
MKNENIRGPGHLHVRGAFVLALLITGMPTAQQNFVPEEATIRETHATFSAGQLTCVQAGRSEGRRETRNGSDECSIPDSQF